MVKSLAGLRTKCLCWWRSAGICSPDQMTTNISLSWNILHCGVVLPCHQIIIILQFFIMFAITSTCLPSSCLHYSSTSHYPCQHLHPTRLAFPFFVTRQGTLLRLEMWEKMHICHLLSSRAIHFITTICHHSIISFILNHISQFLPHFSITVCPHTFILLVFHVLKKAA